MARITLNDIAEKANVSPSTVSRVLNNYEFVDETTRQTVLEIARDLGYPFKRFSETPEAIRTVLVTGMGDSGHLDHTARNSLEFASHILAGAESVLQLHGITVRSQIQIAPQWHSSIEEYIHSNPGLEGLILLGGYINFALVERLQSIGLPFVIVGGHPRSIRVNCVIADYKHGIEKAIDLLAAQGRRNICLLNGLPYTITSVEKYKGFRLALALHDYAFSPEQMAEAEFTVDEGQTAMRRILAHNPDLDAVICGDDYQAIGAMRALQEQGRRIPHDVAVIGHHNYEIAELTQPALTTIDLGTSLMGRLAGQRLLNMLDGQDQDIWSILAPVTLIERGST